MTFQKVEINPKRVDYLLALYKMTPKELLSLLNEGRKKLLTKEVLFQKYMDLAILKRLDKIFEKGLSFYQDFTELPKKPESSVFFRKSQFGVKLNNETIKIVQQFETQKDLLDAYAKLTDLKLEIDIKPYSPTENPKAVANKIRHLFIPDRRFSKSRELLVEMIKLCSERNIFVFEYVETWNKKNKSNIDGFFLRPNMIVLKRQKSYKREIFTLAHELGHCLLGIEEIEELDVLNMNPHSLSNIERWCNDFAFYLIMGEQAQILDSISSVNEKNDYCYELVQELSEQTFISRIAIYTRLLFDKKLSQKNYALIKNDLDEQYTLRIKAEKEKNTNNKNNARTPKPILSPLFIETMQYALYKGVINEVTFCEKLKINPSNLNKYIVW
ncbi:ImmA/IrrE family metallo-endopeptidase [Odoribacter lunatus]|uniref:ImmA/IrrE family metallo-endopeptidase n=1 Tax=Odoribacter lunatus TaxID=2941335 RepID=UPI00203E668F|nr:ImmA/IrrE family metallo-endopeptidase [Odoribacter lunatus]